MSLIRRLPENSQVSISASFSITCLAAAAEELVLNSLDANSTSIALSLRFSDFGVRVEDNGIGINDFELIGQAHCSSRRSSSTSNSRSYGYRGCSLHSISVLSTLEISSCSDNATTNGKSIAFGKNIWSGVVSSDTKAVRGTVATVKGLFSHQIVRQRTMNHRQELEQILNSMTRLSLMHPSVSFLIRDEDAFNLDNRPGREILRIPLANNTLARFQNLFGRASTSLLTHVSYISPCGNMKVSGWLGRGYHTRELQFIYINGRCCKRVSGITRIIDTSAVSGTGSTIPRTLSSSSSSSLTPNSSLSLAIKNEQLLYVLDIVCSTDKVDILHERERTLVEFADWSLVQSTLSIAVKKALGIESITLSLPAALPSASSSSSSTPSSEVALKNPSFLSPEPYQSPQTNILSPPLIPVTRMGPSLSIPARSSVHSSSRLLQSSPSFLSSSSNDLHCVDCSGSGAREVGSIALFPQYQLPGKRRFAHTIPAPSPEAKRPCSDTTIHSILSSTITPPHQIKTEVIRSPYFSTASISTPLTSLQNQPTCNSSSSSSSSSAVGDSFKSLIENGKGSVLAEVDFIPRIGIVAGRPGRATLARFGSRLDKDSVAFMAMLRARQATNATTTTTSSSSSFSSVTPLQTLSSVSCLSSGGSQVTRDILKALGQPKSMIGQLDKKFIACITGENSREVVIIDQHAADERIRLEYIEEAVFGEKCLSASPFSSIPDFVKLSLDGMDIYLTPSLGLGECSNTKIDMQQYFSLSTLIEPPIEIIDSTPRERHLMRTRVDILKIWGWNISINDTMSTFLLRQLPRFFDIQFGISELREFVEYLGTLGTLYSPTSILSDESIDSARRRLYRAGLFPPCITRVMNSKACRGAIMFNDELSRDECIEIVQRLSLCKLPFQCAHGRPSLIPLLSLAGEG
jgi:DNA mismatch repair ATPase MutL